MADVRPFRAIRPSIEKVSRVAALPYDVYNRKEAKEEVEREPLSFLKIDRAETQFPDQVDTYDEVVYKKAKELLEQMISEGTFIQDEDQAYYAYELVMNGRSQTGLVACSSVDDYLNQKIKKHENTREAKEMDRIRHVEACDAQTGPIFLAYRSVDIIDQIVDQVKKEKPLYDFTAVDGVTHRVFKIGDCQQVAALQQAFANIESVYIADGHHRAASAVKVGLRKRKEMPDYTGEEEFNYFLSVLFPHDQLMIMDYNRTIKDLNGKDVQEILSQVEENFFVQESAEPVSPKEKGEFGMYVDKKWYRLTIKDQVAAGKDVVESLDVSLLQDYLLAPILGIEDPRTDDRIGFVGGIRGLSALEKRANEDMKISFSLYPTSIHELFDIADNNRLMPPKSTWFEPKLRSGIFIHSISN